MERKKPLTMVAPPEVLRDRGLRMQFMNKHGRIPVAPGHWSLLQPPTSAGSAELPDVGDTRPVQAAMCANCHSPLPAKRIKYCSDACSDDAKRKNARKAYGHRHRFMCVECGCELRPGGAGGDFRIISETVARIDQPKCPVARNVGQKGTIVACLTPYKPAFCS